MATIPDLPDGLCRIPVIVCVLVCALVCVFLFANLHEFGAVGFQAKTINQIKLQFEPGFVPFFVKNDSLEQSLGTDITDFIGHLGLPLV